MTNKSSFPFHMPKLIAMVGKEDLQIDKYTNSRILEVSKFEDTDKYHFFSVINVFIVKRKIQSIL